MKNILAATAVLTGYAFIAIYLYVCFKRDQKLESEDQETRLSDVISRPQQKGKHHD